MEEPKTESVAPVQEDNLEELVKQVGIEYNLAWESQSSKIEKNLTRLKLYNNQMKDPNTVGDPLLFTIHQTVLAALYDDTLSSEFQGREEGDEETGENLTALAKYDYDLMKKAELDYYWLWDTLFFSRGLVLLYEFDRTPEMMCPSPELIDPMTFLHDPKAISVHGGVKGKNAMRFGGDDVEIPKNTITSDNGYINYEDLKPGEEVKSLIKRARELRDQASGNQTIKSGQEADLGDNQMINALRWFTHYKGKKVFVILANGRKTVIKYKELGKNWPIADKPMYPHSHDWDGTSIPDLVEDKQRQRAVAINLGIQTMKADMYPMYLYDESLIKNKSDLMNFAFNKFVGVDADGKGVNGAAQPLNKAKPDYAFANWILQSLDASAQKATATPDIQQGIQSESNRPLGETNLVKSGSDTRYSLTAKVFGWSEKMFWWLWYDLYKQHLKDGIDKKVIRVVGAMGNKWRELVRENIIATIDPDISIESKVVSENKKLKERIMLNGYGASIMASPNAIGKKYFERKLAKLNGLEPDEVNVIFPPSVDELNAEDENDLLSKDKMVQVNPNDNDYEHMQIHSKAADTKARAGHIFAHKHQLMIKRNQPELFSPQGLPGDSTNTQAGQGLNTTPAGTVPPKLASVTPSAMASTSAPTGQQ